MTFDFQKAALELRWLQDYSQFEQKPASILEFLGDGYLNIDRGVRPGIRNELVELFGEQVNGERIARYRLGMFTGAIGIGKTTMASIVIPYMTHWVLCLKNPQDYYELLPGSRIAFMQMSTSETQAKETVFGDIKARIEYCRWFQENYPFAPDFRNELRFPKDIWILPGNSAETRFEGYNILGGILDEADSHKKTKDKDYAEQGFDTINSRIDSRFREKGFLLVVGQMKKASGFAAKVYRTFQDDPQAHTVRMTIWESLGWEKFLNMDGTRDSFWYDIKRKEIVPKQAAELIAANSENLIEIPNSYIRNFRNNPEKALRDLAGIPPAAGDPFISATYKLEEAVERWQERYDNLGSPVSDHVTRPKFADWFKCKTPLRRAVHLDIAYSSEGDALAIGMGHVSEVLEIDGEKKPYIVFDMLLRMRAPAGNEISLAEARRIIYALKDDLGFRIRTVTMDGFQSTDTKQQLRRRRFDAQFVSIDKSKLPYEDLRDAINESRIEFPPYFTYINLGDTERVQIAVKELTELEEGDKKIDHPPGGSKDVADTMAGVVTTLMGDRSYRRNVVSLDEARQRLQATGTDGYQVPDHWTPGIGALAGLQAPIPPRMPGAAIPMLVPPHLTPRRD